jgi:hypothetical protein
MSHAAAGPASALSCRRRSAIEVTGSVSGARLMPRSMRPGNSASSTLKRSATMSGAWFGCITPPEPIRTCFVTAAIWPIMISGAELATEGQVVMLRHQ